jgi:hypothetical protein
MQDEWGSVGGDRCSYRQSASIAPEPCHFERQREIFARGGEGFSVAALLRNDKGQEGWRPTTIFLKMSGSWVIC